MQDQIKQSKVALPNYTKGEEIFSWVGHCVGAALSVAALVLSVVFSALSQDQKAWKVVSCSIYGATLIILYTMSTLYHALPKGTAKKVFRIIDHCSVSLLIAGTYTPYTLVTLRNYSNGWGWAIFGVVWGAAILSIVLNAINLKKYEKINLFCYLVMGWCIVIAIAPLFKSDIKTAGLVLLILGGVLYTLGAVLYVLGKKFKIKYIHSVWHLFVLGGSILQFFSILFYVI
jgi:hemolysin III